MTAPYRRTEGQKHSDLTAAREFEQRVAGALPWYTRDETAAQDRLDFWVPGAYVEVKEKRQPLTVRWQGWRPDVPERELFVMDELTVRRALRHYPEVYFLLRDVPGGDRMFITPLHELVCVERVRANRDRKGKWLLDLRDFRRLPRLEDLLEFVVADQLALPWKASHCLGAQEAPQI